MALQGESVIGAARFETVAKTGFRDTLQHVVLPFKPKKLRVVSVGWQTARTCTQEERESTILAHAQLPTCIMILG